MLNKICENYITSDYYKTQLTSFESWSLMLAIADDDATYIKNMAYGTHLWC